MSASDWALYARHASTLERIAEIDDFVALEVVLRFNAAGSWRLEIPAGSPAAAFLTILDHTDGFEAVRSDGTTISGPLTVVERTWSAGADRLSIEGVTDDIWLRRRLAYPEAPALTTATSEHDVRTGAASAVLRAYVENNAGPSADLTRRVSGLTCDPDPGIGSTITGRARFQPLDELLQGLAVAGGDIGFRIVQVGTALRFQVYEPTDRTASATFSEELGNLRELSYRLKCSDANFVVVAGGGEGTARTFVSGGDEAQIEDHGRIEVFKDRRDTSDATELAQEREQTLDELGLRTALSLTPIDTGGLAFGTDYELGDKISVVIDDTIIQDKVREVRIVLSSDGELVVPAVGTPSERDPRVPEFLRRLFAAESRIQDLERRR